MSDIHKLSGAYAVDALDDFERARFDQHLATCEDCRAEVAEMRETAALLAETVTATPPASLRMSVLAGISQVRPLPPEVRGPEVSGRRWFPLLVAAALAVIVGVGAMITQPWSSTDDAQLTATEQVLQADDAKRVVVDLGEAGRATVVRSVSHNAAVIVAEDMAPAPDGKVYELWLWSEDKFVPAGLMPNERNHTTLLEGDAAVAGAAGITIEPAGGSQKPTTEPIALFDFSEAV